MPGGARLCRKVEYPAPGNGVKAAPRLQVLAAAVLFSTGGAAIKSTDFSGWQVASFRSAIAALAVLLLFPASRSIRDWRVLVVGTAYAATLILFVMATKLTTAANAIFLQSTAPLYILLVSPWLLRERVRSKEVAFMAVMTAAMVSFFIGGETATMTAPNPQSGNALAVVSGVSWACTLMGMRWMASRSPEGESALAMVATGNVLAFLACLPMALPVSGAQPLDWAVVTGLGVFQIGLAYVCLTRGIRHVPAFEASMLLLVEPALNPIWAWATHAERPSTWALVGGTAILAATAVKTWGERGA